MNGLGKPRKSRVIAFHSSRCHPNAPSQLRILLGAKTSAPRYRITPTWKVGYPDNALTSASKMHLIVSNLGLSTHITPERAGSMPERDLQNQIYAPPLSRTMRGCDMVCGWYICIQACLYPRYLHRYFFARVYMGSCIEVRRSLYENRNQVVANAIVDAGFQAAKVF